MAMIARINDAGGGLNTIASKEIDNSKFFISFLRSVSSKPGKS